MDDPGRTHYYGDGCDDPHGVACEHPRPVRVFHSDGRRSCGKCGTALPSEAPTPEPPGA
jgi:hypothetical protein